MTTLLQYADTVGDGTGQRSATGDYRAAVQEFRVLVPAGRTLTAKRLIITVKDDEIVSGSAYGGNLALASGIEIQVRNASGDVVRDLTRGAPIFTNLDYSRLGTLLDPIGAPDYAVQAIVELNNLTVGSGQSLVFLLNDDFRSLISHHFMVQGSMEGSASARTTIIPAQPATPNPNGYNGTIVSTLSSLTTILNGLYDTVVYQGTISNTLSGLSTAISGTVTGPPPAYTGDVNNTLSGLTTSIIATFLAPVGGSTPLGQPGWLDEAEIYPYAKPGQAYNAATYETLFDESSYLVATNNTELSQHLATARSNSAIRAIYLDPASWPLFTFPSNPTSGINRSQSLPLVIRTLPGSGTAASCAQIFESQYIANIAYVDLNLTNGLRLIAGCDNVLIEKCTGWLDIQGNRLADGNAGPVKASNVHVRLNVMADHWAMASTSLVHGIFTFNTDGLLLEGNIIDHNGWNPAATRSTPQDAGGATTRKHNCYINQPGANHVYRFNFISRASSHGLHLKCGGTGYQNLFVRNPINWQWGYGNDGYFTKYGIVTNGTMRNNVSLDSDDINTSTGDYRGIHATVTNCNNLTVQDNLAIDNTTTNVNSAYLYVERKFPVTVDMINATSKSWYGDILLRDTPNYTPVINETNTQFNVTGLSGPAQALADSLKATSYLDTIKVSRQRLGVNITQLKADIATLLGGVIP